MKLFIIILNLVVLFILEVLEGHIHGCSVGLGVGALVGEGVGAGVGALVGMDDGENVGTVVG